MSETINISQDRNASPDSWAVQITIPSETMTFSGSLGALKAQIDGADEEVQAVLDRKAENQALYDKIADAYVKQGISDPRKAS